MPTREGADALLSYTWAFPICPYRVTIDLSVIAAFQHDLTEAGARQQGLLFGQAHSGLTEIDGRKSLPAFSRDEFAAGLESARREVVGYYSIRDGSAFILAPDEMNVAKDLFHKPGSVVLLIERRTGGPAEGTFLFWRGDSFVHNLPSPFPIDPALLPGVENSALAGSARPYEFSPEPPMPDQIAMVEPAPAKNELSTLGLVVAILTAGLVLWGGLRLRPEAPSQSQAAVPASARAGAPIAAPVRSDLEITWDPKSILTAKAGLLKIEDGGINHQMSLNPDELRFGRVLYSPASDNIKVAMKALDINGSIVEIAASTRPASLAPIVPWRASLMLPRSLPPSRRSRNLTRRPAPAGSSCPCRFRRRPWTPVRRSDHSRSRPVVMRRQARPWFWIRLPPIRPRSRLPQSP